MYHKRTNRHINSKMKTLTFNERERNLFFNYCASLVPTTITVAVSMSLISIIIIINLTFMSVNLVNCEQVNFPGVSRELSSFCAARPSLPIDLASMVVHVKKNVSFNYKLYLFSADYVFQTGQVIPRDDFRIHSFPVKFKRLQEFWPQAVDTFRYQGATVDTLTNVPSETFDLKQFLKPVALNPQLRRRQKEKARRASSREFVDLSARKLQLGEQKQRQQKQQKLPEDVGPHHLPGDPEFISHDVARVVEARAAAAKADASTTTTTTSATDLLTPDELENVNKHIEFDRDDQIRVSVARRRVYSPTVYLDSGEISDEETSNASVAPEDEFSGDVITPVGAFSSFHVNITYLVRKDFDQPEPKLIRIQVDANKFAVTNVMIINNGTLNSASYPQNEDYNFLNHKLLRDPNTRITAINQIYEDWITRNFYTIVYIQRRLDDEIVDGTNNGQQTTIVNDRLVFRGNSIALLGADQLDYSVKAAAFITEKNGLHYYLEFLTTGKFYLCAVDWTKRPFKMIDSRHFPIKATRTQLDNEELLLCPPAVCYSNQPIDEIVNYGRLSLSEQVQRESLILSSSLSSPNGPKTSSTTRDGPKLSLESHLIDNLRTQTVHLNETALTYLKYPKEKSAVTDLANRQLRERNTIESDDESSNKTIHLASISLDNVIEAVRMGSGQLQTKLHLRDWTWPLARETAHRAAASDAATNSSPTAPPGGAKFNPTNFSWRYELAKRSDIKVKPDTYGYVLTGHEIDASYRVYNELYLISANHLITINYTMANETVIGSHPIGDEFLGLSSTLLDPITGAFYDRYANQIYFFKGDRYVGYDYASKKPLEEFMLQEPTTSAFDGGEQSPLISSLPIVGALGRQHQVDGVYHDLFSDLVYIFTGMKFYTFEASEFKNGSLKPESGSLPKMLCINEHFLTGCHFDRAFPNPCQSDDAKERHSKLLQAPQGADGTPKYHDEHVPTATHNNEPDPGNVGQDNSTHSFSEEQQMKLRSIASRPGLLNLLMQNSLLGKGAARAIDPLIGNNAKTSIEMQSPEKVVIYLLIAMVALTILVSIVMIVVLINWTKLKLANSSQVATTAAAVAASAAAAARERASFQAEPLGARGHHYLSNQQQQQLQHSHHRHHSRSRRHHQPTGTTLAVGGRESLSAIGGKPLGSVSVVVSKGRRQSSNIDNSAL